MKREISNWSTIVEIVIAGLARDAGKVANYAALLATHLDALDDAGSKRIAARIRQVLATPAMPRTSAGAASTNGAVLSPAHLAMSPVDAESRSPFVDELADPGEVHPILTASAAAELDRFVRLQYQHHADRLLREGLPVPRALLLYGPPGVGKSTVARHVAHALRLPLLTVRLDAVMSSYLGTTAKNLRLVFEHAARRGGVLFLEEFDALAKMRDDSNEVGEIKRIVNSLIQDLDAFPTMPVIAATNHEHLLDPAIWRRFDSVIHLSMPGPVERRALLAHFLGTRVAPASSASAPRMLHAASARPTHTPSQESSEQAPGSDMPPSRSPIGTEELTLLAEITEGCSGADLEQIVTRARQEFVLFGERTGGSLASLLTSQVWRHAERQHAMPTDGDEDRAALVHFIDAHTARKAPARLISSLTGIPGSTVARIRQQQAQEEESGHE